MNVTHRDRRDATRATGPEDRPDLISHPITELFPRLSRKEFEDLKQDIATHGQQVPIVVLNGAVVDGRHRLQACRELAILPKIVDATGDPWLLVRSLNLRRRHLKPDQIVAIFKKLQRDHPALAEKVDAIKADAKQAQRAALKQGRSRGGPGTTTGKSSATIAALIGTSEKTVRRVDQVERVDPGAVDRIAAGTVSARQVLREARVPRLPVASTPAAAPDHARVPHATPPSTAVSPRPAVHTLTVMHTELTPPLQQILRELEERVQTLMWLLEETAALECHRRGLAEFLVLLADRVRSGGSPVGS